MKLVRTASGTIRRKLSKSVSLPSGIGGDADSRSRSGSESERDTTTATDRRKKKSAEDAATKKDKVRKEKKRTSIATVAVAPAPEPTVPALSQKDIESLESVREAFSTSPPPPPSKPELDRQLGEDLKFEAATAARRLYEEEQRKLPSAPPTAAKARSSHQDATSTYQPIPAVSKPAAAAAAATKQVTVGPPVAANYDNQMKLAVVGEPGVGKTGLVSRLCIGTFPDRHVATIGVDFRTKAYLHSPTGRAVNVSVWDTAGQDRYMLSVSSMVLRGAHGIIAVYDCRKERSVDAMRRWIDYCLHDAPHARGKISPRPGEGASGTSQPVVVVANKIDLFRASNEKHVRARDEARRYAEERGFAYFETSAKENTNVEEMFQEFARITFEVMVLPEHLARLEAERTRVAAKLLTTSSSPGGPLSGGSSNLGSSIKLSPALPPSSSSSSQQQQQQKTAPSPPEPADGVYNYWRQPSSVESPIVRLTKDSSDGKTLTTRAAGGGGCSC